MQSDRLKELENALVSRNELIADHDFRDRDPTAHLEALRSSARRIDEAVEELGDDMPARLAHFLQNRSYQKALDSLQGKVVGHEHH